MHFELLPFLNNSELSQNKINSTKFEVDVRYFENILSLKYLIKGEADFIKSLIADSQSSDSKLLELDLKQKLTLENRRDELWKNNCLEFFIKKVNKEEYFEFNASPNGFWNFYCLSSYRSELKQELRVNDILFQRQVDIKSTIPQIIFEFKINFGEIFSTKENMQMNICGVLKNDNQTTYWAVKHSTAKPDFHDPETLQIFLDNK